MMPPSAATKLLAAAALLATGCASLARSNTDKPMDSLRDLTDNPEKVRQLVPPEIVERYSSSAPHWTGQTEEERTEHLTIYLSRKSGLMLSPLTTKF